MAQDNAHQSSFDDTTTAPDQGAVAVSAAITAATTLIYVSRRDDGEAIWHMAWITAHDPLTIGHARGLCGRQGDLAFYCEAPPDVGALCPKCHRIGQLEEAWDRYPNDALSIALDTPASICRSHKCQAPIWHGITRAKGRESYFDIKPDGTYSGTNHWRTCLDRESFTKPRRTP